MRINQHALNMLLSIVVHAQEVNIAIRVRMHVSHAVKTNIGIIILVFAMKDGIKILIKSV